MAAILRQRQYCGSLPSPSGARARLICRACAKPKTSARTGSSSWSRFRAACGAGGVALALQLGIPGLTPPALASQQGGSSDYVVLERRKIESILEKEFAAKLHSLSSEQISQILEEIIDDRSESAPTLFDEVTRAAKRAGAAASSGVAFDSQTWTLQLPRPPTWVSSVGKALGQVASEAAKLQAEAEQGRGAAAPSADAADAPEAAAEVHGAAAAEAAAAAASQADAEEPQADPSADAAGKAALRLDSLPAADSSSSSSSAARAAGKEEAVSSTSLPLPAPDAAAMLTAERQEEQDATLQLLDGMAEQVAAADSASPAKQPAVPPVGTRAWLEWVRAQPELPLYVGAAITLLGMAIAAVAVLRRNSRAAGQQAQQRTASAAAAGAGMGSTGGGFRARSLSANPQLARELLDNGPPPAAMPFSSGADGGVLWRRAEPVPAVALPIVGAGAGDDGAVLWRRQAEPASSSSNYNAWDERPAGRFPDFDVSSSYSRPAASAAADAVGTYNPDPWGSTSSGSGHALGSAEAAAASVAAAAQLAGLATSLPSHDASVSPWDVPTTTPRAAAPAAEESLAQAAGNGAGQRLGHAGAAAAAGQTLAAATAAAAAAAAATAAMPPEQLPWQRLDQVADQGGEDEMEKQEYAEEERAPAFNPATGLMGMRSAFSRSSVNALVVLPAPPVPGRRRRPRGLLIGPPPAASARSGRPAGRAPTAVPASAGSGTAQPQAGGIQAHRRAGCHIDAALLGDWDWGSSSDARRHPAAAAAGGTHSTADAKQAALAAAARRAALCDNLDDLSL